MRTITVEDIEQVEVLAHGLPAIIESYMKQHDIYNPRDLQNIVDICIGAIANVGQFIFTTDEYNLILKISEKTRSMTMGDDYSSLKSKQIGSQLTVDTPIGNLFKDNGLPEPENDVCVALLSNIQIDDESNSLRKFEHN